MVIGEMLKVLEGFHYHSDRRIVEMTDRHTEDIYWEYPPLADALEAAGIWTINEYIQRCQATIVAKLAFRPIYKL